MNHFNFHSKPQETKRRGQALVEVAILLPLLIAIVLGVVEYSNMFMTALRASNLSRAVADTAFRDCAFLENANISTCLNSSAARASNEGSLVLEELNMKGTVIATTYERDPGSSPPLRLVNQQVVGSGGYVSHYDVNLVDPAVVDVHERIVIGEVIYPYDPITVVGELLQDLNVRTVIYEATIY